MNPIDWEAVADKAQKTVAYTSKVTNPTNNPDRAKVEEATVSIITAFKMLGATKSDIDQLIKLTATMTTFSWIRGLDSMTKYLNEREASDVSHA